LILPRLPFSPNAATSSGIKKDDKPKKTDVNQNKKAIPVKDGFNFGTMES